MAVSNIPPITTYTANGSTTDFSFLFSYRTPDHIHVYTIDPVTENITELALGGGYEFLPDEDAPTAVRIDPPLASGIVLLIVRETEQEQPVDYINQNEFLQEVHEGALDNLERQIQELHQQLQRVPFLSSVGAALNPTFDTTIPTGWQPGYVLVINSTGDGFVWSAALSGGGSGGLPSGGDVGDFIEKLSSTDGDAEWKSANFSGISRFGAWSSQGLLDTITKILNITYTAPTISLSGSSNSLREKGTAVTSLTLAAAITKQSDPIAEVRFYDVTAGNTLLDTQTSGGAIPAGGNSTYAWTGSFSDNHTFRAEVDDDGSTGGPSTVSSTTTYSFVYPYYAGAGASGLSASSVAGLTKRVINESTSRTETIAAGAGEVFYFAYPASYGVLTSILDVNNFETIGDWTLRVENITGLDGNPVSYNIYEFNNPVTAGSYQYTFKQ